MRGLLLVALLLPAASAAALAQDAAPAAALPPPATPLSVTPSSATAGPTPSAAIKPGASAGLTVLLGRARLAGDQGRIAEAREALSRALRIAPDDADALVLQAQIEAAIGSPQAAATAMARLRAVHPDDPRIPRVAQALVVGQIDPAALAEARRLGQANRGREALAAYQHLFNGQPPPDSLAAEYFETLAGTEGGWPAARDGLQQAAARNPGDTRIQLAYARILTYRDATRLDGIDRLAVLVAKGGPDASSAEAAWRQAAIWLPATPASAPALQAFLAGHPNDAGVRQRLEMALNPPKAPPDVAGQDRMDGFAALNAGRLDEAERLFQDALQRNDRDADATGGLGIVRLRQGKTAEARTYLQRAITLDPADRDRWQAALAGATSADDAAAAQALLRRGDTVAGEAALRRLGGSRPDLYVMLAQAQARQGNTEAAESTYRAVLARDPANVTALIALSGLLTQQGKTAEAEDLLARAAANGGPREAGAARAQLLRQQAAATTDPQVQIGLYQAAAAADPSPWIRLDLARAQVKARQVEAARATMAELTDGPHATIEALQAGIIFANEIHDLPMATALIARLPARGLTPDLLALRARAALQADIQDALALADPAATRQRLLALAAAPDPDGSRGAEVARAFAGLGDKEGARQAISTAMAVNRAPSPAARLAYAGALLGAGDAEQAARLVAGLDAAGGLTPEQRISLDGLRAGLAVTLSDQLNASGHTAAAYDRLAPVLAQQPDNPDLNLALGRLYQTASRPQAALNVDLAALRRDPTNAEARRAAVGVAIREGQMARAAQLAAEGLELTPNEPAAWEAAADVAQARGRTREVLRDLQQARNLRRQQILPASAGAPVQVASLGAGLAPASENPFRDGPGAATAASANASGIGVEGGFANPGAGPALGGFAQPDQTLESLDQRIAALQEQAAPDAQANVYLRNRSGSSGLDQLNEEAVPIEATFSPGGVGYMTLEARPTFLSAGTLAGGLTEQQRFGTSVFGGPAASPQNDQGVGLDAKYVIQWLSADVGTTPIGFPASNVIGGIELSPELGDGWRLRVLGERRAVTDSLLSYGGTRDAESGELFGAVTRTRGHAQIEYGQGAGNIYFGGGYDTLTGQNVVSNSEVEFGAGGSYPVYKTATEEVRVGLDLVYFGYDKNLRYFTLGQGGYFSPQSYVAALIPVTYREQDGKLTWSVGGAAGYQSYQEDASNVFPGSAALQSQLVSLASTNALVATSYPADSQSGLVGSAHADAEYTISTNLRLGGQIAFQHSGNWSETVGSVFARYVFLP